MKKQKTITGYKFIKEDMFSQNGDHKWSVGKWYFEKDIKLCEKGFHACREPLEALDYMYGDKWFIVEARGEMREKEGDKFVAQEMRLVREIPIDKVVKPFAIWCAKQCLKNYEKQYPKDKRPRKAIEGAELYLDGKIDLDELKERISAAYPAYSAVYSAANSAYSAANSAANSAAYSAYSAANSASRLKQNKKLKQLIEEVLSTPENIKILPKNSVFIFGSNLAGRHGAGAAKFAKDKFGAKLGVGEGLVQKSYAFPSLDENLHKRTTKELKESVKKLVKCANENPDKLFYLTKVGTGLGGYKESYMKKLFKNLPLNISLPLGW